MSRPPLLTSVKPLPANLRRQIGNGMSEFLLAAIPVMLLGLALIEAANWLYIKQMASLALLEAGRAGITSRASPEAIDGAFMKALEPLYPPRNSQTSQERLAAILQKQNADTQIPPWQIRIVQPARATFDDFNRPGLQIPEMPQLRVIENAYQAEQDEAQRARGWADGKGPRSGQTIYEANILVLELNYLHRPLVPGMASMLKLLAGNSTGYRQQGLAAGYLPIRQSIQLGMQSSPANWPSASHQRVVNAEFTNPTSEFTQAKCTGAWCFEQLAQNGHVPAPITMPESTPLPWVDLPGHAHGNASGPGVGADTAASTPASSDTDALCGISLCCGT